MFKKGIIVVTIIILISLGIRSFFQGNDDTDSSNYCMKICFIFDDGTWESCSKYCGQVLDTSPRYTKRVFKPYRKIGESVKDPDCPLGYSPKIVPKQKNPKLQKPNIVFILLDDQDELTSPYLDEMPFVKQLLYQNGTSFTHAFAPSPICCAARCQLLTGLYGHNNGVLTNSGKYGGYTAFMKPYNQNGTRLKDNAGRCINNEDRFLPSMLLESGYETQAVGKYINQFEFLDKDYIPDGWSDFKVGANHKLYSGLNYDLLEWNKGDPEAKIVHYGLNDEDYSTDVIRDIAVEFVRKTFKHDQKENQNKSQQQFTPKFMYVAVTAPHFPLQPPKRHLEKKKHWKEQFGRIVVNRTNYEEKDISDKSSWLQDRYRGFTEFARTNIFSRNYNTTKWHEIEFPKRMASLAAVDELVQSIHKELTEQGEIDNTVFVLTSDNGYNLGSHRLVHKMAPYEESIRIPLAISGPGIKKGKVINDFVKLQDLAPTILEFAGIEIPEYMDGVSLKSSISESENHEKEQGDADILIQYAAYGGGEFLTGNVLGIYQEIPTEWITLFPHELMQDVPPYIGIRTKDYSYFKYSYYGDENQVELYDMNNDSSQMENICKTDGKGKQSERCIKLLSELDPKLEQLRVCSGKSCNRKY